MMRKIFFVLFALLFVNTTFADVKKISLGIGQSTLAMEDFNDYTQNGMITSQMNFEKIKTGSFINVDIVSDLKKVKPIDLVLSIGYLSTKTIGSADSLFYWENHWEPGKKTTYDHYAIPMLLSAIYNIYFTSDLLNKFNADVGCGLGIYHAVITEYWETINSEGIFENTWEKSYSDSKIGYHLSSTISYNLSKNLFLGLKVIYRDVNEHEINNSYDLDFSGFGYNINLGINFR